MVFFEKGAWVNRKEGHVLLKGKVRKTNTRVKEPLPVRLRGDLAQGLRKDLTDQKKNRSAWSCAIRGRTPHCWKGVKDIGGGILE